MRKKIVTEVYLLPDDVIVDMAKETDLENNAIGEYLNKYCDEYTRKIRLLNNIVEGTRLDELDQYEAIKTNTLTSLVPQIRFDEAKREFAKYEDGVGKYIYDSIQSDEIEDSTAIQALLALQIKFLKEKDNLERFKSIFKELFEHNDLCVWRICLAVNKEVIFPEYQLASIMDDSVFTDLVEDLYSEIIHHIISHFNQNFDNEDDIDICLYHGYRQETLDKLIEDTTNGEVPTADPLSFDKETYVEVDQDSVLKKYGFPTEDKSETDYKKRSNYIENTSKYLS